MAIATSKFTGNTNLPSVLVVRKDDPANGLEDLEGARFGYINKSCSSSYFAAAILLEKQGKKYDDFLNFTPHQGEGMMHDLENVGTTELLFVIVEFLDNENPHLELVADELADLSTPEGARYLQEKVPAVDILVNSVGFYAAKDFHEISDEDWDQMMDLNLHFHLE